jgi:hypothetical protein
MSFGPRASRRTVLRAAGSLTLVAGLWPLAAACGSARPTAASGATAGGEPVAPAKGNYAPPASNPQAALTAPYTPTPPALKGVVDASWKAAQKYILAADSPTVQAVGKVWQNPPLQSSTVHLLWDAKNLYVAEERVQSPEGLPPTFQPAQPNQMYLGNSLGIFFANADFGTATYQEDGHYTVWGGPTGGNGAPAIWLRAGDSASGAESDTYPRWPIAIQMNKTGYVLTMAIPWSALQAVPWTVGKGARLAFTLLATAAGPSGQPWGQIMLVGDGDEPDHWGVLTLQ